MSNLQFDDNSAAATIQSPGEVAATRTLPKLELNLSTLITTKGLAALCNRPDDFETYGMRDQPAVINLDPQELIKECKRFCRDLCKGQLYASSSSYFDCLGTIAEQRHGLQSRLKHIVADLLTRPLMTFVGSLRPANTMQLGRLGTWKMLKTVKAIGEYLGWCQIGSLGIEGIPRNVRSADVMQDWSAYVPDPTELRALRFLLEDRCSPEAGAILAPSNPLTMPAIELRLICALRNCVPQAGFHEAVWLRQSERVVVIGASADAVTAKLNEVKEELALAGLRTSGDLRSTDLRAGGFRFRGFLADTTTGAVLYRIDAEAYRSLEARFRRWNGFTGPATEFEIELINWVNYFAPGLVGWGRDSEHWAHAADTRRLIQLAVTKAGIQWPIGDVNLDRLCETFANNWYWNSLSDGAPSWIYPPIVSPSETTEPVAHEAGVTALA